MKDFIATICKPLSETPFRARPLAFAIGFYLISLFLMAYNPLIFIFFAIISIIYIIILIAKYGISHPLHLLISLFLIISVICGLSINYKYDKAKSFISDNADVRIKINYKIYAEKFGSAYNGEILTINGEKCDCNAVINFPYEIFLREFDTVHINGEVKNGISGLEGPELLNAKSNKNYLEIDVTELNKITNESKKGINYSLFKVRNAISSQLDYRLPKKVSGFAKALLIGDKSELGRDFRNNMSAIGVSHILAVSGLHTSVICGFLSSYMLKRRTPRKRKSLLIAICALSFMGIAGFSPSVSRAVLMLIISVSGYFFHGMSDSVTSLFIAGFLITLVSPETIISCSFLLSFFACFGIVVIIDYMDVKTKTEMLASRKGDMKGIYKFLRNFLLSITVSVSASLVPLPVLSLYFSEFSFISPITNIVIIPLASISLFLAIFLVVFAKIPFWGYIVAKAFELIYTFMSTFAEIVSKHFKTSVSLKYPFFPFILLLLLVSLVFICLKNYKSPVMLLAPFLLCAIVFGSSLQVYEYLNADRAEAIYYSDKSSEGFLVNSGNKTIYIDLGKGGKSLPINAVKDAKNQYQEIIPDAFMLTHYHTNHIALIKWMIYAYGMETFYLPTPETQKEAEILSEIRRISGESKLILYNSGDKINLGNVKITLLKTSEFEGSTHPVTALSINLNGKKLFWTSPALSKSSISFASEKEISNSSIIICGHHGASDKNPLPFNSVSNGKSKVYVTQNAENYAKASFPLNQFKIILPDKDGLYKVTFAS